MCPIIRAMMDRTTCAQIATSRMGHFGTFRDIWAGVRGDGYLVVNEPGNGRDCQIAGIPYNGGRHVLMVMGAHGSGFWGVGAGIFSLFLVGGAVAHGRSRKIGHTHLSRSPHPPLHERNRRLQSRPVVSGPSFNGRTAGLHLADRGSIPRGSIRPASINAAGLHCL